MYNETSYSCAPTFPVRTQKSAQYHLQLIVFNNINLKRIGMMVNTRGWYLNVVAGCVRRPVLTMTISAASNTVTH
jgi:hypothetical protein